MCPSEILLYLTILCTMWEPISAQISLSSMPGLFIDRLTLADASASRIYYDEVNISSVSTSTTSSFVYYYSWRQTLPNSQVNYSLSFHNYYEQNIRRMLSFKVQLSNLSISGAKVQMSLFGVDYSFTILTFNVILVPTYSNLIQLISCTRVFSVLNVFSRANSSEYFQEFSYKFHFNNSVKINTYYMLQWIAFTQVDSDYQIFIFLITQQPNSNVLKISCTSNIDRRNTLNSFKINILLINPHAFMPNIATYYYSIIDKADTSTTDFSVPSSFGGSLGQNNCFFGLKMLERVFDNDNTRLLFAFNGNKITELRCNTYSSYFLEVSCFGECPRSYFVNPIQPSTCQLCSQSIPKCLTCYSTTNCTQCNSVSFLTNSNRSCTSCLSVMSNCVSCINTTNCTICLLSRPVNGGCTNVTGCTLVVQKLDGTSYCAFCDPHFDYDFTSKICVCKIGRIAGSYCTQDPGCAQTQLQKGVVKCSVCLMAQYFLLDSVNHRCYCSPGFFLNTTNQCQQICGDGVIHYLQCDDGNIVDGDGCSSVCAVEVLYQCTNDSIHPSFCRFYGFKFQISLVDTQKVQNQNTAIFTFQFKPKMLNLGKLNLSDYFRFTSQNYSVKYWTFSDGYAKLYVDYSSTLQGQKAAVNFSFDGNYFNQRPMLYEFQIKSRGTKLIYENQSSLTKPLRICIFTISVAAWFLLFFGSWFNKMIGVEYLQTLQVIYFSHFAIRNYTYGFSVFQYLALVGINDRFFIGEQVNFHLYQDYQMLTYKMRNTQVTIIAVIVLIILSFLLLCFLQFSSSKIKKSLGSRLYDIGEKVMSNMVFSISLGFTYPSFFILTTLILQNDTSQQTLMSEKTSGILVFLSLTFYSILIFQYFKFFLPGKINIQAAVEEAKKFYLIAYNIFMYLIIISLWIWLMMGNLKAIFAILVFLMLKLILWIISKPYHSLIDNLGITLNIGVTIFFLIFVLVINLQLVEVTELKIKIFVITVVSLLYVCFGLSVIRVILTIKNRKKDTQITNENQEDIQKQLKYIDKNQLLLNKQIFNSLSSYNRYMRENKIFKIREGNTEKNDQQFLNLIQKKKKQLRSKYGTDSVRLRSKLMR